MECCNSPEHGGSNAWEVKKRCAEWLFCCHSVFFVYIRRIFGGANTFRLVRIEMNIEIEKIDRLREMLSAKGQNIVIVAHTNPDGDAIGSSLAWGSILESLGHSVSYVVPNKYPYFLEWIAGIERVRVFKDDKTGDVAAKVAAADMIFCMDFNQIGRLEMLSETIEANTHAKRILIDHHLSPPNEYDLMFSYTESSSTAYIVYRIIEDMVGLDAITLDMAQALYVGFMTDTGNFSFSNLTPELFRAVAVLVEKGINIQYINSSVYNSFSEERVRLLGYSLNKMEVFRVNKLGIAYIGLTEAELRKFKFQVGDSEGFVNYPLIIQSVSMSAMFIETRNFIRISLRSRGDVDVNLFARKYFEGGGHKNASGGKSFRSLADTLTYFRASAEEYFRKV